MIELRNVTKTYADGTTAVDDLSFVAPAGQITVLVGPSGCGKTTTLRMINRLIGQTSGAILLDGEDSAAIDAIKMRRRIGYVIQSAGLFPHRTVLDNVCAVPFLLKADKETTRARAMELLTIVGLDGSYAPKYPWQLSGGQKQRVGVARALAADPPYLLMDEPFSAVDPIVRKQLQTEFLRIQAEFAKTIVLVTHDIDEALRLGDQIVVLQEGGHLAQYGTPAELLAQPANRFVAEFLGTSRGYHALSFRQVGALPVQPTPSVFVGEAAPLGWTVVVDADRRPLGWVHRAGADRPVDADDVHHVWPVSADDGNYRELVDATFVGPEGRAIIVGADGRYVGTVGVQDVIHDAITGPGGTAQ